MMGLVHPALVFAAFVSVYFDYTIMYYMLVWKGSNVQPRCRNFVMYLILERPRVA